jgi:hypothetical protein
MLFRRLEFAAGCPVQNVIVGFEWIILGSPAELPAFEWIMRVQWTAS